jgi:hypothetical protein
MTEQQLPQLPEPNDEGLWKSAVLDQLAIACMDAPLDEPPASILKRVIAWNVEVALDPRVSERAEAIAIAAVAAERERVAALPSGRDGERYRWLRQFSDMDIGNGQQAYICINWRGPRSQELTLRWLDGIDPARPEELDAAIDAAMSAAPAMGAPEEGEPAAPSQGTLTDEEIMKLARRNTVRNGSHEMCNYIDFARAILAAQGKKK